MKNKKGLSAILATLLVVLVVFVAVGIVWAIITNVIDVNEKHFQIYKEECGNKTIYPFCKLTLYISLGCPHCERQKSILEKNNIEEEVSIVNCFKETKKCFDEGIMAVPSWKVGGNEAVYIGMKTMEELGEILNESWEEEVCELVEVNLEEDEAIEFSEGKIFSPIYDGVKWFEENCLCSKCIIENNIVEGIKECEGDNSRLYDECSEYHCGNYTVEVWDKAK
jgi:flagellin-like protein